MLENIDLTSMDTNSLKVVKVEISANESVAKVEKSEQSETVKVAKVEKTEIEAPPDDMFAYPAENTITTVKRPGKTTPVLRLSQSQVAEAHRIQMRCRQLCASVFVDEQPAVRSLGFTSAIDGEGKSFLARLSAVVMATDLHIPATLVECNWEHPCFNDIFNLAKGPGLAEWLRGECELEAIRQPVSSNLTVIRAGDDRHETIRLLQNLHKRGLLSLLDHPNEVLIVDLPSLVTTAYGRLAASLAESLIVVVRMGVTPDAFMAEASTYLKDLRVHGVILNQVKSRLPRWLEQIL